MNDIVNHHKDQLTKSAKFISRDSKLFIMATTETMRSYLLLEMSLHIKSTFLFFFLAIEVFKSLIRINQNFMRDFNTKKSITCLLLKNSIYQKQINHVIVWIPKFSA